MNLSALKALLIVLSSLSVSNAQQAPPQVSVAKLDTVTIVQMVHDTIKEAGNEYLPVIDGYRVKVADAAIVTLTLLLTIFNGGLWLSARRAERSQRTSSETQVRAYVGVTAVQGLSNGSFTTHITNGGETPAYDVKVWLDYSLGEPVSQYAIQRMQFDGTGTANVVGPLWNDIGRDLTIQIETFESEKADTFYAFGLIVYKDVFGTEHFTTYQSRADYNGSSWEISDHFEGNLAT